MLDIIAKIQDLYQHLTQKKEQLDRKEQDLNARQQNIESAELILKGAQQDFASREQAVAGVEITLAKIDQLDKDRQALAAQIGALKIERDAFETLKNGEHGKIIEAKKALDASWKELNQAKAKMESEVQARVQEALSKIRK